MSGLVSALCRNTINTTRMLFVEQFVKSLTSGILKKKVVPAALLVRFFENEVNLVVYTQPQLFRSVGIAIKLTRLFHKRYKKIKKCFFLKKNATSLLFAVYVWRRNVENFVKIRFLKQYNYFLKQSIGRLSNLPRQKVQVSVETSTMCWHPLILQKFLFNTMSGNPVLDSYKNNLIRAVRKSAAGVLFVCKGRFNRKEKAWHSVCSNGKSGSFWAGSTLCGQARGWYGVTGFCFRLIMPDAVSIFKTFWLRSARKGKARYKILRRRVVATNVVIPERRSAVFFSFYNLKMFKYFRKLNKANKR